jgi:CheY-like chemotaxis protein
MSDSATLSAGRIPTVYFIDDSATMREVIKIAFRKENVQVITCADAASALAQFSEAAPDAVITDVIMPDKDGYEVCDFIKHHERFSRTPVILMSGIVNKTVAEKAMSVKADELIRKPFHPQDLIGRVKALLGAKILPSPAAVALAAAPAAIPQPAASQVLTNFFAPSPAVSVLAGNAPFGNGGFQTSAAEPRNTAPAKPASTMPFMAPVSAAAFSAPSAPAAAPIANSAEIQKLRNEVRRLELLVKRLQAELEAGKEYCASLEAHVKTMQD